MTVLTVAYNVISPIAIVVVLSALAGRYIKLDLRTISNLIMYLFSPMLVLNSMANSAIQPEEFIRIMGLVLVLTAVMSALGFGISRLMGFDRGLESVFLLTIVLMNAGNYGVPLNEFAFGTPGMDRALIYYVTSAVLANTYGVYLASRGKSSVRESVLNVFKLPMVYFLVIGLALNFTGTAMPLPLERASRLLGDAAVPGMLVLLGLQLGRASLHGRLKPIMLASGMRLVVAPLVALGLALLFGMEGLTRSVVIVESAMPTAVMSGALAIQFDADDGFVVGVILFSTALSVVTLSILLALLGVG